MSRILYDIDKDIESCMAVDEETGEVMILDCQKLNELQLERDVKIERAALYRKELRAKENALKTEKLSFDKRQKAIKNAADGLDDWIAAALQGQRFETAKVDIKFRKSEAVSILDMAKLAENFLRVKTEADLTAIKDALKKGEAVEGAELVEKQNIQIK